jgi:hypothetical protein
MKKLFFFKVNQNQTPHRLAKLRGTVEPITTIHTSGADFVHACLSREVGCSMTGTKICSLL